MEEIKIIYEDDDLLVLDKPAGIVTTKENSKEWALEDWLIKNRPNSLSRQGIAHRLDKGTSGIVITAKNEESLKNLKSQFKKRQVRKYYLAMASGDLPSSGEIDMPIDRSKYSFGRFKVNEDGKNAKTLFKVIKKLVIDGKKYSLVEVDLKTGRTHQIRVHLSYLGWPLLGDKLYGGLMVGGITRPFLHAKRLEILGLVFEAPLAADLKDILEKYEG